MPKLGDRKWSSIHIQPAKPFNSFTYTSHHIALHTDISPYGYRFRLYFAFSALVDELLSWHASVAFHSSRNSGSQVRADDVCLLGCESESDGTADARRRICNVGNSVKEALSSVHSCAGIELCGASFALVWVGVRGKHDS